MGTKGAQINLRLPADLDDWIEEQAGAKRKKPAFIRHVLERARARAEEGELQAMFDDAWQSLPEAEREAVREEREEWLSSYSRRERP